MLIASTGIPLPDRRVNESYNGNELLGLAGLQPSTNPKRKELSEPPLRKGEAFSISEYYTLFLWVPIFICLTLSQLRINGHRAGLPSADCQVQLCVCVFKIAQAAETL